MDHDDLRADLEALLARHGVGLAVLVLRDGRKLTCWGLGATPADRAGATLLAQLAHATFQINMDAVSAAMAAAIDVEAN